MRRPQRKLTTVASLDICFAVNAVGEWSIPAEIATAREHFDEWDSAERTAVRSLTDHGYEYRMGERSLTDAEWELMRCWYDGEIAYLDSLLGTLVRRSPRSKFVRRHRNHYYERP